MLFAMSARAPGDPKVRGGLLGAAGQDTNAECLPATGPGATRARM